MAAACSSLTRIPPDRVVPVDIAFIVGAARSGTSLLYKALCLHPEAAFISNWLARTPGTPAISALNRVARRFPGRVRNVWFGEDANAYVYGQRRPLLDRVFPMPVEGEPVYTHAGVAKPGGRTPRAVDPGQALPAALASVAKYGGGNCVVSKRIANNLRIPVLAAAAPQARYVDLTRDGRAVALSLSRVDWWEQSYVWWYGGTPSRWRAEGRDPWEICARNWSEEVRAIEEGLAAVPETQVMRMKYEDVIADPIPAIEEVARFVGLGPDARWRRTLQRLRFPDRNETWRERLEPEVVARITELQREELDRHGYR
jgi:hypothetical protein